MDAKITLSFNADIIALAKAYATEKGISLSRLTEYLYSKMTADAEADIYALPINDWVLELANGTPEYQHNPKSRKARRTDYYSKYESTDDNIAAESPHEYKFPKKK